jgi:peptide/nickel transport system substrate-binding protein
VNGRYLIAWLRRNWLAALAGAVVLLLVLWLRGPGGDDGPQVVEVTRLVTVTAPDSPVHEVTRVVVVTATPPPTVTTVSPDPDTLHEAVVSGPISLDPAEATDSESAAVVRNVLDTLIFPNPLDPGTFLPVLATRWQTENNGQRYVFTIRRGVSFSDGTPLTAEDVAYSLQRVLLQSSEGGPQGLLLAPLLGYESGDVAETLAGGTFAGNRAALLENTTVQERNAVCVQIQQAIRGDPAAGTVTLDLVRPWAPLLATLSQPWAGIVSREWATARGDWDGSCDNWADWYAPARGDTALATAILGSGPYVLDHWTPDREYVLTAYDEYWRSNLNPMWSGGPGGPAAVQTIRVLELPEDHLRWQALRDGEVATAPLSSLTQILADQLVGEVCARPGDGCVPGPVPDGPLRRFDALPEPDLLAIVFNFNMLPAANPYIGSAELDGTGVPVDFFSDEHVRRAFAYCLDEAAYMSALFMGEGTAAGSLLPAGWGQPSAAPYGHDSQRCAEELQQAFDGQLEAIGFRLQIPYLAGDSGQQTAAALLQARLQALSSNYVVETVGLPRATYVEAYEARQLPLAFVRWQPPVVDPHYYFASVINEEVAAFQRLPGALQAEFDTLVDAGSATTELGERRAQYVRLETLWHDQLPFLVLPQPAITRYEQRWLRGWRYHPEAGAPYYYAYWQEGRAR